MVPKKVFFTKGVGVAKHELQSFELALRNAGLEKCNLVNVSSIVPPSCEIIPKNKGIPLLKIGGITHCVLSRNSTKEPNRLVGAAIGVAVPKNKKSYGIKQINIEINKINGDCITYTTFNPHFKNVFFSSSGKP